MTIIQKNCPRNGAGTADVERAFFGGRGDGGGIGLIQKVSDIGSIVVSESGGVPAYVQDLARVSIGAAPRRFQREIRFPPGHEVLWGGRFENLARACRRLAFILPVTVGRISGLFFLMFGSTRWAGLALLNVPFSIVGGILMLSARGINFSVSAAVGFISLFGVAFMIGVLIAAEINRVRREFPELPASDAIVRGATSRFRGVLLMIFLALLGMVPAARATGVRSDVQRPLASLVGGLLSTLPLALVCLPALYTLAAGRSADQHKVAG